jgi:predicted lysophospholipase L1 biosynthesis ABC-type transport system permease subunit
MTHLRKMMLEELQPSNYSENTIRSYIRAVEDFARRFDCPPDRLGPQHIRQYQAELFQKRKLSLGTVVICLAALRFFYSTHDIGVLVALGALPGDIIRLVVRQGMELAAIGILAGLAGAAVLTHVMASLLFGVSTTDAITFVVVPALLTAVAFAATLIPAWRTTRADPMVALREE